MQVLLLGVVIVLTVVLCAHFKDKLTYDPLGRAIDYAKESAPASSSTTSESETAQTESFTPGMTPRRQRASTRLADARSTSENLEYFESGNDADSDLSDPSAMQHKFNAQDFNGKAGMEYKDWVAAEAVDPAIVENHKKFVHDRMNTSGGNILGRTYTPDSHDSYDPIPWVGLRRPQAVTINNPTQVPDIDISLYATKPTFTWSSS